MLQDDDVVIEDEEIIQLEEAGSDKHVQELKARKEELEKKMEEKKRRQEQRKVGFFSETLFVVNSDRVKKQVK